MHSWNYHSKYIYYYMTTYHKVIKRLSYLPCAFRRRHNAVRENGQIQAPGPPICRHRTFLRHRSFYAQSFKH